MDSVYDAWLWHHADCSIRKSAGQSLLTAHRSLSQLTTSFIGSQCQGIRPALLFALPFVMVLSSLLKPVVYPTWQFSLSLSFSHSFICYFLVIQFSRCLCSALFQEQNSKDELPSSSELRSWCLVWWAQMDSNHRPHAYQACALTTWAMRPFKFLQNWTIQIVRTCE